MHLKFLYCVVATMLLAGCSIISNDNRPSIDGVVPASDGYIRDNNDNVLVSGDGSCFRSTEWSEANQLAACETSVEKNDKSAPAPVVTNVAPPPVRVEPAPIPTTVERVVLNSRFLFQTNASQFASSGDIELNALIEKLSTYSDIKVIDVIGHTDDRGSDTYNQSLSERRATTVKNKLEPLFPQVPIFASGLGETAPIASNNTEEGRQQNRRVEIRIETVGE